MLVFLAVAIKHTQGIIYSELISIVSFYISLVYLISIVYFKNKYLGMKT